MTYETICLDIADQIATITLNRPERLNAMGPQMADEISLALDNLGGARVVLVTGEGRAFCSGADLSARGSEAAASTGPGAYAALTKSYNPLMMKLAKLNVPVITAVNGPAAGIGCSLRSVQRLCDCGEVGLFPSGLCQYRARPRWRGKLDAAAPDRQGQGDADDDARRENRRRTGG